MFDLDKIISEAYGNEPMSFEKLAEMVEDMLILQESLGLLSEDEASGKLLQLPGVIGDLQKKYGTAEIGSDYTKLFPKFEISEAWGLKDETSNVARQQFKKWLGVATKGVPTIKGRLQKLNEFTFQNNYYYSGYVGTVLRYHRPEFKIQQLYHEIFEKDIISQFTF